MNNDIALSRARVSRRRALSLAGGVSLTGLLSAACATGANTTATGASSSTPASASPASGDDAALIALLASAPTCVMSKEVTQGPYWFDVDSVRRDIREDRPGLPLRLAIRVQDTDQCTANGELATMSNAVVEIWHCDAGGVYSGFESGSRSANGGRPGGGAGAPPSGPPPGVEGGMAGIEGNGEKSDGSYSEGDQQAETTDDGTYLRGAQVTNSDGVVYFDTIYPGWYTGRTTHIHVKVHVDKKTLLTAQLYFDDTINDAVYSGVSPYTDHTGRDTRNDSDGIFDATGMMVTSRRTGDVLAAVNLGISV